MGIRFSERTGWDTGENALARAVREVRGSGGALVDLTVANPTVCGFKYDVESILGALRNPAAMAYAPEARGILTAREAIAEYYREHQALVDPDAVLLTTSTSEAYSFLFRLLCDSGDAVLVAQPSYPLFDFLADLNDVRVEPYRLFYDFGWWIDFAELERKIGPRTRAVVVVHPNNPTGHVTSEKERALLGAFCARHGLALIVDEVFLDYGLERPVDTFVGGSHACLVFVVSGLSKVAALPQMKVGWVVALGPQQLRNAALARLEVIADTFLSMSAPAQYALPVWLAERRSLSAQICRRLAENVDSLRGWRSEAWSVLPVEAGWSAVVQGLPSICDEDLAERLVREIGVIVHPGLFYGLRTDQLVLSVLGMADELRRGLELLNEWSAFERLT